MIICVCNALNETTVRQAAQKVGGKTSILKIYESLDAKPKCGKCLCMARDICNQEMSGADLASIPA
ncbi:(2Fe-2S)-binding protein [Paremcibacter congregatus]|uniref:(2Fe-2S)-binding protein n=1 Tax=Paremcibacter congregatus TaxID=2043170 RepID=A0A2G4YV10_9PROT|nr:(2Fe-2S)-binding protein [Paremcibacter congregatus]PHZ86169.1 (2Fe-2S)-binding protein [Paremcibacter congregatus]QDE27132.1 (2Fe-2S)-binding protein [Paremcibacter congregatus]